MPFHRIAILSAFCQGALWPLILRPGFDSHFCNPEYYLNPTICLYSFMILHCTTIKCFSRAQIPNELFTCCIINFRRNYGLFVFMASSRVMMGKHLWPFCPCCAISARKRLHVSALHRYPCGKKKKLICRRTSLQLSPCQSLIHFPAWAHPYH